MEFSLFLRGCTLPKDILLDWVRHCWILPLLSVAHSFGLQGPKVKPNTISCLLHCLWHLDVAPERDSAAKRLRFSFAAGILRRTLRWRNSRGTGRESRDRSFQLFTLSGFLLGISVTCYFLLLHSRLCQSATVVKMPIPRLSWSSSFAPSSLASAPVWNSVSFYAAVCE